MIINGDSSLGYRVSKQGNWKIEIFFEVFVGIEKLRYFEVFCGNWKIEIF